MKDIKYLHFDDKYVGSFYMYHRIYDMETFFCKRMLHSISEDLVCKVDDKFYDGYNGDQIVGVERFSILSYHRKVFLTSTKK